MCAAFVEFVESQHPRAGKGSPTGGQFVSKGSKPKTLSQQRGQISAAPQQQRIVGRWQLDDDDRAEIAAYKDRSYQELLGESSELSPAEKDAVDSYVTPYAFELNSHLRAGTGPRPGREAEVTRDFERDVLLEAEDLGSIIVIADKFKTTIGRENYFFFKAR